uniref:helix-turn-helix domain-containing protein n=1 Tax=Kurthia massiliensis TaxID=1033739 RepID=UPI00028A25D2
MSYCHLTISERSKIEVLKGLEYSCRAIARHLNRSHTTISRELKRLNEWSAEKAPWQHGTNENSNGLLREFFPKRMDLGQLTPSKIEKALSLINNRPRK